MDATRQTLLARVKDGSDSQAWKEFAGLYRALLARYIRAAGLPENWVEELTTQCMTALSDHVSSPAYDPSCRAFKRWIWTLVRRRTQDALRTYPDTSGPTPQQGQSLNATPQPDRVFERIWHDEHLRHCLEQLRIEIEPRTFEVFRRIALDEWPVERSCEAYDLSPQYVFAMKSRLTRRLRRLMQSLLGQ